MKPLLKLLGNLYDYNLSLEIQRFLREKEKDPRKKVNHNRGEWYTFSNCTMIRIYGFEGTPHLLPRIVLDRLVYLENVRQLAKSDAIHIKGYSKQSIIPSTLCFGDFTIVASEGV